MTTKTRLREYRLKAGITQAALARRLNIAQANICKAEKTGEGIGNANWFRLADFFNVDPRILRGWQGDEQSAAPTESAETPRETASV